MTKQPSNDHGEVTRPRPASPAPMSAGQATLADLVAPLWTEARTQQALNLSSTAMADRRQKGSLLALTSADNGGPFYPVAQFERHRGQVRVRPALLAFMMVLRSVEPWTVAVLMHTPSPELDDRSPLEWAREKRPAEPLRAYAVMLLNELRR